MLTHRITLPDGTEIEFFASDEETFNDKLGDFAHLPQMPTLPVKKKANKAAKQAQKRQKQARRKQR